jgi:hypothetical protein
MFPVGAEFFHGNRETDMLNVIVTFRKFANAHDKRESVLYTLWLNITVVISVFMHVFRLTPGVLCCGWVHKTGCSLLVSSATAKVVLRSTLALTRAFTLIWTGFFPSLSVSDIATSQRSVTDHCSCCLHPFLYKRVTFTCVPVYYGYCCDVFVIYCIRFPLSLVSTVWTKVWRLVVSTRHMSCLMPVRTGKCLENIILLDCILTLS